MSFDIASKETNVVSAAADDPGGLQPQLVVKLATLVVLVPIASGAGDRVTEGREERTFKKRNVSRVRGPCRDHVAYFGDVNPVSVPA